MVVYFRSYVILICAIAVALPIAYSTIYPFVTGQLAASSLSGLITMFLLFAIGLLLGFGFFERRAQSTVDKWVSHYNDDCDPEGLIRDGSSLYEAMRFPYKQPASWFMSYYAQARLDLGDVQDAKDILEAILASIDHAKKAIDRIGILVNAVPLAEKVEGPAAALSLIDRGLDMCDQYDVRAVAQYREFLEGQRKIMQARVSGDPSEVAKLDGAVWTSSRFPRRIRVEYAWDAASADFKAGDIAGEKQALEYVVSNGGALALVGKARQRLDGLS